MAQKDYAISLRSDTIRGELKILSFDNMDRLQINSNGKKTTYTALQLRSFSKDSISYESVKYENTIRFMRVLKSGYLSLYAFNPTGMGSWDGRYITKKNGTGMELPNLAFKKILIKYLEECDEVVSGLEKGNLSKKDILRIVDLYNNCNQGKSDNFNPQAAKGKSDKLNSLKKLSEKVEALDFLTKKDALELIRDLQNKVSKNEAIPNYLIEGLKSYLVDTPSLSKDVEEVIALLKK
ncbi:hypothetical protein WSM22_32080 [Cytophagales bacterium WSM2-2]|nr:hypothetical protein WSM22_32080 [Cytophagales bacterium WSM2-2]